MPSLEPLESDEALWHAPLARMPTWLDRLRSRTLRSVTARVFAPSVVFVRAAHVAGPRRIALTFDDGPDSMTDGYLDVLRDLGVRSTFFVVGENAARTPNAVAECVRRGHVVGSHGWSHAPFPTLDAARLTDELARTWALIPKGPGSIKLVRPPCGAISPRILLQLATSGYVTVLWSVDSDDCRTRDPGAIARRLSPQRVRSGDVVLMHESQPWTIQALAQVVAALRAAGYEFVTVADLMSAATSPPHGAAGI
jgi:peptidoglycan-N-acetylglucosamine deacetylase